MDKTEKIRGIKREIREIKKEIIETIIFLAIELAAFIAGVFYLKDYFSTGTIILATLLGLIMGASLASLIPHVLKIISKRNSNNTTPMLEIIKVSQFRLTFLIKGTLRSIAGVITLGYALFTLVLKRDIPTWTFYIFMFWLFYFSIDAISLPFFLKRLKESLQEIKDTIKASEQLTLDDPQGKN